MTPEQLHNAYTAQVSPSSPPCRTPACAPCSGSRGGPLLPPVRPWPCGRRGRPLTPAHGGWYNALYTGPKPQETLFWDMVSQAEETLPQPPFLPRLLAYDRTTGRQTARAFLDLLAGLLPLLAGADGGLSPSGHRRPGLLGRALHPVAAGRPAGEPLPPPRWTSLPRPRGPLRRPGPHTGARSGRTGPAATRPPSRQRPPTPNPPWRNCWPSWMPWWGWRG